MRYLKIKDNVDLKELEKFGFKELHYINGIVYGYDEKHYMWNFRIVENDRIIHFNQLSVENKVPTIIYDLIKADLVEVMENEK